MSGGVTVGDVNGDGYDDLFFPRYGDRDRLYLNDKNGGFVDGSIAAGFVDSLNSTAGAFGDVDNDGDLDLYVTTVRDARNHLYINDGRGVFAEQAVSRGAHVPRNGSLLRSFGATFADYDNDGWLDLYTGEWGNSGARTPGSSGSRLLRNTGDGFFEDVTVSAGLALETGPSPGRTPSKRGVYVFSPRFHDLDRDGHLDLTLASDFGNSRLFWNNGDGTFSDGTSAARVGTDENGMGSTVGDFDGDGLLDWFVTSVSDTIEVCENLEEGCDFGVTGNRLYKNNGDRTFTDVTDSAGVRNGFFGWGTSFFDPDNDGDLDLAETNGFIYQTGPNEGFRNNPSLVWENLGLGRFDEVSAEVGVTDNAMGKGLVTLDYDGDGDQDLLITNNDAPPTLYRNDSASVNDWIRFDLEGVLSNREGLGAVITVTESGRSWVHEVNAGSNYLGHGETTAHFGLGNTDGLIDRVTVYWPASGVFQTLSDLPANNRFTVREVPEPSAAAMALCLAAAWISRRHGSRVAR